MTAHLTRSDCEVF